MGGNLESWTAEARMGIGKLIYSRGTARAPKQSGGRHLAEFYDELMK